MAGEQGWGSIAGLLTNAAQTYIGVNATSDAQKQEQAAIDKASGNISKYYGQAQQQYQPYADMGSQSMQTLNKGVQSGDYNLPQYQQYQSQEAAPNAPTNQFANYKAPEFNYTQDPGYQMQLQQGNQQIQAGAAAQGGLLSGSTQKALAKYGVGLAAQDYNNAFQRYSQNRNFDYQNMSNSQNQQNGMYELGLGQYNKNREFGAQQNLYGYNAGVANQQNRYGQQATLAQLGPQMAGNIADLYTNQGIGQANLNLQAGQSQAAATMGKANLISQYFGKVGDVAAGGGSGGGQKGGQQGSTGGGFNLGSLFGGSGIAGGGAGAGNQMTGNDFSGSMGSTASA